MRILIRIWSRKTNQCGSGRIPIRILIRLLSHKKLNFYTKNRVNVGNRIGQKQTVPMKAENQVFRKISVILHAPGSGSAFPFPFWIRIQDRKINARPGGSGSGSTTLNRTMHVTRPVQFDFNLILLLTLPFFINSPPFVPGRWGDTEWGVPDPKGAGVPHPEELGEPRLPLLQAPPALLQDGRGKTSVPDLWHFGVDPDLRIHASDKWIRILPFSSLTFKTPAKN